MSGRRFGAAMLAVLSMTIGCGGGDDGNGKGGASDGEALIEKYAPKDCAGVLFMDVAAARKGVSELAAKFPEQAQKTRLAAFTSILNKIDAIAVYAIKAPMGPPVPVVVMQGDIRPGDLLDLFSKLNVGGARKPELMSMKNGRHKMLGAPFPMMLIDGREADDVDGNVIVLGMDQMLRDGFVAALGEGEPSAAIAMVLDKADLSANIWGGLIKDDDSDPYEPKSVVVSANIAGDKLFQGEFTYVSEEMARKAEDLAQDKNMRFLTSMVKITRSGDTLSVKSVKSGNLADLLVPPIQHAIELANQSKCMGNLNAIGKGCALHRADERTEKFPADMKVLIDKKFIMPSTVQCPSDKSGKASSYFYLPPSPDAAGRTLIMCDLKGNHKNLRNVCFMSGAVMSMTEEEFQAELKKPRNAAFAAALEKAGG